MEILRASVTGHWVSLPNFDHALLEETCGSAVAASWMYNKDLTSRVLSMPSPDE